MASEVRNGDQGPGVHSGPCLRDHSHLLRERRVCLCRGASKEQARCGNSVPSSVGCTTCDHSQTPWTMPGAHLASACAPQVHTGAQPHAEHIEGGPVHQVEVEVVLKLGSIQHLERNLGDLARGLPWRPQQLLTAGTAGGHLLLSQTPASLSPPRHSGTRPGSPLVANGGQGVWRHVIAVVRTRALAAEGILGAGTPCGVAIVALGLGNPKHPKPTENGLDAADRAAQAPPQPSPSRDPGCRWLTVKRPLCSGVDGCSLRSSVCGSCTFSMPAPNSSFFSSAE